MVKKTSKELLEILNKKYSTPYYRYKSIPEICDKVIVKSGDLTVEIIKEIADYLDWREISKNRFLSEDFIREFADKIDWDYISKFQILSEDFIKEFKDKVIWWSISCYQNLSEDFIREFADDVDWEYASGPCVFTRKDGKTGWYYPTKEGGYRFTQGYPSRPFMTETAIMLSMDIVDVAKEVFGGDSY